MAKINKKMCSDMQNSDKKEEYVWSVRKFVLVIWQKKKSENAMSLDQ